MCQVDCFNSDGCLLRVQSYFRSLLPRGVCRCGQVAIVADCGEDINREFACLSGVMVEAVRGFWWMAGRVVRAEVSFKFFLRWVRTGLCFLFSAIVSLFACSCLCLLHWPVYFCLACPTASWVSGIHLLAACISVGEKWGR